MQQMDHWRWNPSMGKHKRKIPAHRWRKSAQWFTLTRPHAFLYVNDTDFDAAFSETCFSHWDQRRNRYSLCLYVLIG